MSRAVCSRPRDGDDLGRPRRPTRCRSAASTDWVVRPRLRRGRRCSSAPRATTPATAPGSSALDLRGLRGAGRAPAGARRRRGPGPLARRRAHRAAAPHRRARHRRRRRRRRRLDAAPRRGVRRRPLRHRRAQGHRADLEEGALGRRRGLGPRGPRPRRPRRGAGGADERRSSFLARSPSLRVGRRLGRPRAAPAQADRACTTASTRSAARWTPWPRPTSADQRGGSAAHAPMARDLAIDLGTANTLVYERGPRHRAQRAVGDRPQQPHQRGAGDGPRGVADDRPHARLHHRRAPAARRRHHRLRHHPAHDPAAAAAGRASTASTGPGS